MMGEYDAGYEHYIDSLIREIEKLQDENDKLREQVSSIVGRSFRTADKMSCIEADNAKLSALCIGMFVEFVAVYGNTDDIHEYAERLHEVRLEVHE